MNQHCTSLESLALTVLVREGIAAIWELHLDAASAYNEGKLPTATAIIELADAAEREVRRNGQRDQAGDGC